MFRFSERPANAPGAKPIHDALEIAPSFSQMILRSRWPASPAAFNNTGILQLTQTRNEQRSGNARKSAFDAIELTTAGEEFADDERGPAIGENFRCASNGAVLTIFDHAAFFRERPRRSSTKKEPDQSDFRTSANPRFRVASQAEVTRHESRVHCNRTCRNCCRHSPGIFCFSCCSRPHYL